nr:hypothetical protein [Tanacetum cinerariifolium]
MSLLQEALDACAALTRRVEHLEYDKVGQALEITKLKRRVKKLEKGNMVRVLKLRRLKKVGTSQRIDTSEDTVMDDASNQGRIIDDLDKDDVVALMDDREEEKKEEEAKVVKDDQVQGRQVESQAESYKIDVDHALKVLSIETVTATSTIISAAEPQVPAATITAAPEGGNAEEHVQDVVDDDAAQGADTAVQRGDAQEPTIPTPIPPTPPPQSPQDLSSISQVQHTPPQSPQPQPPPQP